MIHITTAELDHLKDKNDYHIKYHIRLIDNALQFIESSTYGQSKYNDFFHFVKTVIRFFLVLLDERDLLTGMAYVDLNPIRAAIAKDLKCSDFTSIKERVKNQSTWLSGFGKDDSDLPF